MLEDSSPSLWLTSVGLSTISHIYRFDHSFMLVRYKALALNQLQNGAEGHSGHFLPKLLTKCMGMDGATPVPFTSTTKLAGLRRVRSAS
ncbi:hypothetical protein FF1_027753 [Malus domestica]